MSANNSMSVPQERQPTVSVVIPNYNHARYLRKRIDSVLTQTYQDFEVIVLDDCSTDDSRTIIGEYANDPRVRIELNEKNSGSTFKQWNRGVGLARGKYVWIAESDDYADARLLSRLVPILERQPEVALAYCRSWLVMDDNTKCGYFDTYLDGVDRLRWTADFVADGIEECRNFFVLYNTVPNASAAVFRKSAFEGQGRADERLRICGDYKLWAGMALSGSIAFVAEPLNFFRRHDNNVHRTSRGLRPFVENFYVVQWLLARIPGDKQTQQSGVTIDELPVITDSMEEIGRCRSLADELEAAVLRLNPGRAREIGRAFQFYRLALANYEFGISTPARWRFFLFRCALYRYEFPVASWKRRVLDFVHLIEALIGGFRNRHWLGKKYAPVRRMLQTFAER
jgi:glycosyltransferase involved in cell wall biosynthesis